MGRRGGGEGEGKKEEFSEIKKVKVKEEEKRVEGEVSGPKRRKDERRRTRKTKRVGGDGNQPCLQFFPFHFSLFLSHTL